jgi:4-methyl-5(b-hydroxyethyl)-thiazole monophosphate biosynthesis
MNKRAAIFLADGFEEIEAVTLTDILRRADICVQTVSVMSGLDVTGAHGIVIKADMLFDELDVGADILILPGGLGGTVNIKNHAGAGELLKRYNSANKWIAAICAAPTVLDALGLLEGKSAVCYPSCEPELLTAIVKRDNVCVAGNVITSRGPGTTAELAFKIVEILKDTETADALKERMLY